MRNSEDEITKEFPIIKPEQNLLVDTYVALHKATIRLKSLGDLDCENIADELRDNVMTRIEMLIPEVKELVRK